MQQTNFALDFNRLCSVNESSLLKYFVPSIALPHTFFQARDDTTSNAIRPADKYEMKAAEGKGDLPALYNIIM